MSIYLIWFLVGVSFLIAEFLVPTFVMFFFAVGAFIVSLIASIYDLSFNFQVILFAFFSVTSLLLLRSYMKNVFKGRELQGKDKYFDDSIDSNDNIAIVSRAITPDGFGEIKYKGIFYKAQSKDSIDEGKKVKVVSKEGGKGSLFTVEEMKN